MVRKYFSRFALAALCVATLVLGTAAQMPNPYGAPITLEQAKKAAAPAMAEAEKMDATQLGSANFAVEKARSAALFKRPTKAFQDTLAGGGDGLRVLKVAGAIPVEGGLPILQDGKIIGAIGVSGGASTQDAQCAKAGADTIK